MVRRRFTDEELENLDTKPIEDYNKTFDNLRSDKNIPWEIDFNELLKPYCYLCKDGRMDDFLNDEGKRWLKCSVCGFEISLRDMAELTDKMLGLR